MAKKKQPPRKRTARASADEPQKPAADPPAKSNGSAAATMRADEQWPDEPTPIAPPPEIDRPSSTDLHPFDPDPPTGTSEKRLFRRIPFFRKIDFKFESMEDFRSEYANDLSIGGMFIKTDKPEPLGTVIFLRFALRDGSKILSGYGKVVRVNPKGQPDFDPGMGVEFLKFDEESRQRIRALVANRFP